MDANELRALQAPLKKQYREQPETARTPARAEAMVDFDRVACRVRSWGGETGAGLQREVATPHGPGVDVVLFRIRGGEHARVPRDVALRVEAPQCEQQDGSDYPGSETHRRES